eukprot:TRINITY_DN3402_c0_g5_i6.p1 TRINITY_DN3402_c0_g5~~TRINITY_DN3402_c0_g5_i6.p1  ORF type:complete len:119 (+),score=25.50 TRINITY_DN3402_c0_g5_i6:289-645(+)
MVLYIEIPFHQTVKLVIAKQCSKEGLVDRLAEKIVAEEEQFGILKLLGMCLLILLILYVGITCYNLYKGKKLSQSVPCGGGLIAACCGSGDNASEVPAEQAKANNVAGNFSELSVGFT